MIEIEYGKKQIFRKWLLIEKEMFNVHHHNNVLEN